MKRLNEMLCVALFVCAFCVFGCKNSYDDSEVDKPPVSMQPGDNVVFSNQTEFAVKVYSDSTRNILVADIAAKGDVSCHVDAVSIGNAFYFSYFMDINGVSVPYGVTDSYTVQLKDDSVVSVKITDPQVVNTNKKIILLKNEADSAIVLYSGNIEKNPEGKSTPLVNGSDYGIYVLGTLDDIETFTVVEGTKSTPLSAATDFESGYIYTIVYDGTNVYMRSKSFLDKDMNKKIWKISLSRELGKTLMAGVFKTRENPKDGYMLFGRQVYVAVDDDNIMNNGAIPYYAFISLEGNLVVEQSFSFADNPNSARFRDAVEYGDYILVVGVKDCADGTTNAFVSSVKGCNIYKDVYSLPDSYVASHASNIIHKKDNVFCCGLMAEEEGTERYRTVLVEITINGYTSATTKVLWESDDERDLDIKDLVYDESTDTYIVLGYEYDKVGDKSSYISFIDGTSGKPKQRDLVFDEYVFEKISKVGNEFIVCGSFKNPTTGKEVACLQFIDIASGSLDSVPILFQCKNGFLFNRFNSFLYEDDALILAGFTDREDEGVRGYPYLVKYDLKSKSVVFEQKYADLNGYEIHSCHSSDMGFILELYNEKTMHSFLISTGLLGELPEATFLTLPKKPSKIIPTINLPVYLYDGYESEEAFAELDFKYGVEITMSDLEQYAEALDGYSVVGWYDWRNGDQEDVEVSFPFVITETMGLYPKFKISPPTGVYGYALYDSEIHVQWDAHPFAKNYCIYWSNDYGDYGSSSVSNSTHYTISDLRFATSYVINLIAYDDSKLEWSNYSSDYTVKTGTNNWSNVPSNAKEITLNTGKRYEYMLSNNLHYYYAYFEAGKTYRVQWSDSDNKTGLDGYYSIADVVVYTYYAGDGKGVMHNTDCNIDFYCTRSGYYIMEVRGFSKGYYAIECYESQ